MNLFQRVITDNKIFATISGAKILAFVLVALSPLQYIIGLYDVYVKRKRLELKFNGQVCYLEHILNDTFDPILRRIFITDPNALLNAPPIIFNIADNQPSIALFNIGDTGAANTAVAFNLADFATQYDFVLHIPTALNSQQLSIRKTTDSYKEASKYYQIQLF